MSWKITMEQFLEFQNKFYGKTTSERLGQAFCNEFNPPKEVTDKLYEISNNKFNDLILNLIGD